MTRRTDVDSWIYFIQEIEDDGTRGPIKIGKANDPHGRRNTFQTGNSRDLRILRREPGGLPREDQLHDQFARHQIWRHGKKTEWFQPHADILNYIRTAPRHNSRRRFTVPSIPVMSAIAWMAVIPRGAWRIILAILTYVFVPRRRRRTRPYAATGALIAAGGTALTYTQALTPAATVLAIAAAAIVACTIAGATRYH